jgi:hypothetical protein
MLMWRFTAVDEFIGPVFLGLQTLPSVCWVPLAVLTMVLVSRATPNRVPGGVGRTLLRLHAPERLGLGEMRVGRG